MELQITQEEKSRSYSFAQQIIKGNNQFNRFNKSEEIQVNRTYVGKLAEYVFLHYLQSKAVLQDEGDMFKVYLGAENADHHDFLMPNGKSIDIKAAWQTFHSRIMIPISQLHLEKDYYVGIKLNFPQANLFNHQNIQTCNIHGYATRETMQNQPTENFGEGDCKAYLLRNLTDINKLVEMFLEKSK